MNLPALVQWIEHIAGLLRLIVDSVKGEEVRTTVVVGGELSNNKGINLPGIEVSAPAISAPQAYSAIFGSERKDTATRAYRAALSALEKLQKQNEGKE